MIATQSQSTARAGRIAEIAALRHAVPYLALFRGRTFVVKIGGGALGTDARLVQDFVRDPVPHPREG